MTDLPARIYDQVEELSEQGNVLLEDKHDWRGAVAAWTRALDLLPEPRTQWEAAMWLYASTGDALRTGGDLAGARSALLDALNCPDGHANPFVLLRLGETLVDLGEMDPGVEHLLRAYMLAGEDVFEGADAGYLKLLRDRKLID